MGGRGEGENLRGSALPAPAPRASSAATSALGVDCVCPHTPQLLAIQGRQRDPPREAGQAAGALAEGAISQVCEEQKQGFYGEQLARCPGPALRALGPEESCFPGSGLAGQWAQACLAG